MQATEKAWNLLEDFTTEEYMLNVITLRQSIGYQGLLKALIQLRLKKQKQSCCLKYKTNSRLSDSLPGVQPD